MFKRIKRWIVERIVRLFNYIKLVWRFVLRIALFLVSMIVLALILSPSKLQQWRWRREYEDYSLNQPTAIQIDLTTLDSSTFPETLVYTVNGIKISKQILELGPTVCIDSISIAMTPLRRWTHDEHIDLSDEHICVNQDTFRQTPYVIRLFTSPSKSYLVSTGLVSDKLYYIYPLDQINLRLDIQAVVQVYENAEDYRTKELDIEASTHISSINFASYDGVTFSSGEILIEGNHIVLRRSLLQILLICVLIPALTMTTFLLSEVKLGDGTLEITLAIFLGAWAVRDIIVIHKMPGIILLDFLFISIYLLTFFFLLKSVFRARIEEAEDHDDDNDQEEDND